VLNGAPGIFYNGKLGADPVDGIDYEILTSKLGV
jgi:hypothetical protein